MTRIALMLLALTICVSPNASAVAQESKPRTDSKTPTDSDVASAIDRACEILLENQESYEPDRPVGRLDDDALEKWQAGERKRLEEIRGAKKPGSEWPYEGVYRVRPDGRIPSGYRVGGTSIVALALLDAPIPESRAKETKAAIDRAIRFVLDRLSNDPTLVPEPQTKYDVRGWGHIYALALFLRVTEKNAIDDGLLLKKVEGMIPHLIQCLEIGQVARGGWNYAGRGVSPFMTGAALLTLFEATSRGHAVDASVIEKALDQLERARGESTAYAYSGRLRDPNEPMEGACARSAIAELALLRAGRSNDEKLRLAVNGFFTEKNWQQLRVRKSQQGTHVAPYGVAPYYFFFGHTYAAIAAEHLPEAERPQYRSKMRELLWRTIENGGSWNDRIFPRTESYSTAMSVLSLIADRLPKTKAWKPPTLKKGPPPKPKPGDESGERL